MSNPERRPRPLILLRVLGLVMLTFGLLQLDDPDPFVWVGYYVAVSVACAVAAYRPMPALLFWPLAALTVLGVAFASPGFFDWLLHRPAADLLAPMSAERMYIEESRELLGLVIAGAFLLVARSMSRG